MTEDRSLLQHAEQALIELLARVPALTAAAAQARRAVDLPGFERPDLVVDVRVGDRQWQVLCAVKAQAQPRHARAAVLELKAQAAALAQQDVYPVLVAPYLSAESADICRQAEVGYLDLAGNCRLSFGTVFIERAGAANPNPRRRELRSLFAPKAARILRLMLREPGRHWRVVELAQASGTSVGQVSNVRKALVDREWAAVGADGLALVRPQALLDAWRGAYARPRMDRQRYYTLLHGDAFEEATRAALAAAGNGAHAMLAGSAAARWLAPFARGATQAFYADAKGEALLRSHLQLEPASRGENVVIDRTADDGLFADRIEAAPGLWSTGLVQTYLDLEASGKRGNEAAQHLRQMRSEPMWKGIA